MFTSVQLLSLKALTFNVMGPVVRQVEEVSGGPLRLPSGLCFET